MHVAMATIVSLFREVFTAIADLRMSIVGGTVLALLPALQVLTVVIASAKLSKAIVLRILLLGSHSIFVYIYICPLHAQMVNLREVIKWTPVTFVGGVFAKHEFWLPEARSATMDLRSKSRVLL